MVDGTLSKDFNFVDDETRQLIKVRLSIRDGVYFKILEKIANAIERLATR